MQEYKIRFEEIAYVATNAKNDEILFFFFFFEHMGDILTKKTLSAQSIFSWEFTRKLRIIFINYQLIHISRTYS